MGAVAPERRRREEEEEEEVPAEARGKEAHSADPEEGPAARRRRRARRLRRPPAAPATSAMDWFLPLESEAVGDSEPLVGTFAESLAEPTANRRAGGDDDGGGDDVSELGPTSPDASAAARPATAFEDGAIGPGGVRRRRHAFGAAEDAPRPTTAPLFAEGRAAPDLGDLGVGSLFVAAPARPSLREDAPLSGRNLPRTKTRRWARRRPPGPGPGRRRRRSRATERRTTRGRRRRSRRCEGR